MDELQMMVSGRLKKDKIEMPRATGFSAKH